MLLGFLKVHQDIDSILAKQAVFSFLMLVRHFLSLSVSVPASLPLSLFLSSHPCLDVGLCIQPMASLTFSDSLTQSRFFFKIFIQHILALTTYTSICCLLKTNLHALNINGKIKSNRYKSFDNLTHTFMQIDLFLHLSMQTGFTSLGMAANVREGQLCIQNPFAKAS